MNYFIIFCRLPLSFPRQLVYIKGVTAKAGDAALGTNGYGWQNSLYYQGVGGAMLFGLIPIHMEIKSTIDAQSGELLQEEMTWWAFFCALPPRSMGE